MTEFEGLVTTHAITATAREGARPAPDFPRSTAWTVTLRRGRHSMRVPFYMGEALTDAPTAPEVLDCLLSDAGAVIAAGGNFEAFCDDLGLNVDSRHDLDTFLACQRIEKRLRRFLGDDFDMFLYAER